MSSRRAYLDFGLDNPALLELMFRSDQLHADDAEIVAARGESLGVLLAAVAPAPRGAVQAGDRAPAAPLQLRSTAARRLFDPIRDAELTCIAFSEPFEPGPQS